MTTLALIPARGGSKGIPRKNLVPLAGKPLIGWTIEAALGAGRIDRVVVTSEDEEILAVSRKLGAETPFVRPAELARDDTPALPVVKHAVEALEQIDGFRPDYIALLQPTSPLRTSKHVDEAIELLSSSDADSVVSVIRVPHQFNPYSIMVREGPYLKPYLPWDETRNLRQCKPEFWARNGAAVYAFSRRCLLDKKSLYGDRVLGYEMPKEDSVDVDDVYDLQVAEFLLKGRLSG